MTKTVFGLTLEEVSEKIDKVRIFFVINYMHVFRCKIFLHALKNERSEVATKSEQCDFINYYLVIIEYMFYDSIVNKFIELVEN